MLKTLTGENFGIATLIKFNPGGYQSMIKAI